MRAFLCLAAFIVKHRDSFPGGVPIVVCCKGIENGSLLTPFEILEEELPGKVLKLEKKHHRRPSAATLADVHIAHIELVALPVCWILYVYFALLTDGKQ